MGSYSSPEVLTGGPATQETSAMPMPGDRHLVFTNRVGCSGHLVS